MFEDQYPEDPDGLGAARGIWNGTVLAVVFFWLPLGVALAWWLL